MKDGPLLLGLNDPAATLANAGGKGANLVRLARAGFDVPPAFLLTTAAYRAFVEANGLEARIAAAQAGLDAADPHALERASTAIRAAFAAGTFPAELGHLLAERYRALGEDLPVAVRSSATAEDLPGLSFAGQQDTFLNVRGTAALHRAVIGCWSSLWTARAMGYRARNHIPQEGLALAVVVQAMVDAAVSGVMFTADPLSGDRGRLVVDATFGLGEALVSGLVTPDHVVVDRRSGVILSRALGGKGITITSADGGGTEQRTTSDAAMRAALSDAEVATLAALGARIEAVFGGPQDIEFARAETESAFRVLQSRPITTLYPAVAPGPADDSLHVYFSFNSFQGIAAPFSPQGLAVMRAVIARVVRALAPSMNAERFAPEAGGRLYLDLTPLLRDRLFRRLGLAFLQRGDPTARAVVLDLIARGLLGVGPIARRRAVLHTLAGLHSAPGLMLRALRDPAARLAVAMPAVHASVARTIARVQAATTLPEVLAWLDDDLARTVPEVFPSLGPVVFAGFAMMSLTDALMRRWLKASTGESLTLMRGVRNTTTDMNLQLWQLATEVRTGTRTRADALADFLAAYGARGAGELDIAAPRWRDEPEQIAATLDGYLALDDPQAAPDAVFARGEVEAARLMADVLARARASHPVLGGLRARLLDGAIRRARVALTARETPKQLIIALIDAGRTALLRQGAALVNAGALARADDIFFLSRDTLMALGTGARRDLRAAVAAARAAYAAELARPRFPRVLLSTGEAFYGAPANTTLDANTLAGEGVSPGVVEGIAHIITNPREERLAAGEILVCVGTDPGWTPLFLTARALVTEVGGMVTHGSVVAREYGIPAVVGVDGATTRLVTGERIRVDGSSGRVTRLT